MNNEFLWRKQMRKLDQPAEPAHDLWPAIAARIATATPHARVGSSRRTLHWFALAASLVVAIGAALIAFRTPKIVEVPVATTQPVQAPAAQSAVATAASADLPLTALDWAQPSDPALAASAAHLDLASAELQDALEQRPDAVFLVGLLNRTNAMRLRLLRKAPNAG